MRRSTPPTRRRVCSVRVTARPASGTNRNGSTGSGSRRRTHAQVSALGRCRSVGPVDVVAAPVRRSGPIRIRLLGDLHLRMVEPAVSHRRTGLGHLRASRCQGAHALGRQRLTVAPPGSRVGRRGLAGVDASRGHDAPWCRSSGLRGGLAPLRAGSEGLLCSLRRRRYGEDVAFSGHGRQACGPRAHVPVVERGR